MEVLFSQILNMSMTASAVIVLVMLARLALKRVPKIYSYALWSVVLFRLLCPVSFSGQMSVLEVTRPRVAQSENVSVIYYDVVEQAMEDSGLYREFSQQEPVPVQALQEQQREKDVSLMAISAWLWLTGLSVMMLASIVNYLQLHRRLQSAVPWRGEIYLADNMEMPFVLGILSPRIYLPSGMTPAERRYIVAHERHHIKRLDPLWKLLGYGALCIHWFNPLVWLAFNLAGKDMEMSCDEAVIKRLGPQIRADYAQSLLRLSTGRSTLSGMPLAFGEGDTKGRVRNMVKWRRPKLWVSIVCIVLCIIIGLACALNPEEEQSLGEMTHWEGPSSCAVGDLNYYLPEGCAQEQVETMELSDWELKKVLEEKKGIYPYAVVFKEGETTVGGINRYHLPESFTPANFDWIEDLGLWEFEDETLGHMAGSGTDYVWEIEFFSDLPEDAPDQVLRKHYFFLSEDMTMAYDLWFDRMTVNEGIYQQILNSCVVGGDSHKPVAATRVFLDFETYLPDGYVLLMDQTNVRYIAHDNTIVGGITAYEKPALELKFGGSYPMEEWNSDEWLSAMGFEEEKGLAYIGGGSIYGDFERCYSSDVPEGQPITDDRYHTFFIREEYVYDVWFDMLKVSGEVRDSILRSVSGRQVSEPQLPAEEMFQENFVSNDGTVNISMDANIPSDFGNVGCSILEAVPHYITEEEAEHIAYTIFGADAEFTRVAPLFEKYNVTEEQLQSAIDRSSLYTTAQDWEPLVGSGGAHGSTCEELAEQTVKLIESWEDQLANFRCNYPEEACDFTYQNDAYYHDAPGNASDEAVAESGNSIAAWVEMGGYSYKYQVTTRDKDDFKINNIYVSMEWPVSNSELDSRVPRWIHCTTKPTEEHIADVKNRASEILNHMGLGYWIIDEVYVETHTYNNPDVPEYIIKVNAVPIVDGVPAIRWGQHGTINTKSDNDVVDNYYLPMAAFSYAADGTLLDMILYSPMEETVLSRTNTGLSNQALLEIAVEELKKININDCGLNVDEMGYHPRPNCDVEISNIRVGYARVRVAGTDATYRYIPALSLYGRKTYTFANGDKLDWMDQPENVLTLNALDGSVLTDMKTRITLEP